MKDHVGRVVLLGGNSETQKKLRKTLGSFQYEVETCADDRHETFLMIGKLASGEIKADVIVLSAETTPDRHDWQAAVTLATIANEMEIGIPIIGHVKDGSLREIYAPVHGDSRGNLLVLADMVSAAVHGEDPNPYATSGEPPAADA